MRQIIESLRNGKLAVATVPEPGVRPGHVLIANAYSVISAGTEKMAIELARKSLLGKARERPAELRRVIEKLKSEGFFATLQQVSARLDEPLPMGYSCAGVVLACGAGVRELSPGDRVASNGPHAEIVCVPRNLCARVPEGVPLEQAAFGVLGAVALQGVRLAKLELSETAFVIGLGLVGQLAVAILRAAGVRVIGTDPDASRCELAMRMGAEAARPGVTARDVEQATRGLGADAVIVAAATSSDEPMRLAAEAVRKKGRVVLVGVSGLSLDRRPLYFKECELVVSCSYGPGRYDPDYEERGHDYPAAYVRWTEQRNLQAVLDLMAQGRLDVAPLISHRFPIEKALDAYKLIEDASEPYLGLLLQYPEEAQRRPARRVELSASPASGEIGFACLGAGSFARGILLPALAGEKRLRPRLLCSAGGLTAKQAGERFGFEAITTEEDDCFADRNIAAVFIATRHGDHARQVVKALAAGKHVFVEKPLCLTLEELAEISSLLTPDSSLLTPHSPLLMVGFNRRFSPAAAHVRKLFADVAPPIAVSIRFNAGAVAAGHWTQDEEEGGGRLIGEACHAIDLATFLAGSPPVRVFAEAAGGADDRAFITLRHANGSISSVAYLAGGDPGCPKERVEVIGGGRVAVIDDLRTVTTWPHAMLSRPSRLGPDKGHRAQIAAFARTLSEGGPSPISWEDIRAVTLASILAVRSLREGMPFEV
jgi:predicted dehydrogenase/threonine dehydrogenase-like Zn-dependent dehydrogenase